MMPLTAWMMFSGIKKCKNFMLIINLRMAGES